MSESPFLRYKDVLVNDHSASAKCLRSIVLSMVSPYRYAVTAADLSELSPEHFEAAQALIGVFKAEFERNREAKEAIAEIEEHWPDYMNAPHGIYPFPDPDAIFVPDQAELSEHFQPFFGIDLNLVNQDWHGYLTMLGPLEPTEHEKVGEATEDTDYHSILLHTNWIGFKVEEGRYRLMGDPRYFFLHKDNEHLEDPYVEARERLEALYADQKAAYAAAKKMYEKSGRLFSPSELAENYPLYNLDRMAFFEQIGGVADFSKFPISSLTLGYAPVENGNITAGYPISPAGRPFHHVASVPAHHYQSWGADLIMMFYEPEEELVLFTFYSERRDGDGDGFY